MFGDPIDVEDTLPEAAVVLCPHWQYLVKQ